MNDIEQIIQIHHLADRIFGDRNIALAWLYTPCEVFNDRSAVAVLMESNGIERVLVVLNKIECGELIA